MSGGRGGEIEFHITAASNGHNVMDEYGALVERELAGENWCLEKNVTTLSITNPTRTTLGLN